MSKSGAVGNELQKDANLKDLPTPPHPAQSDFFFASLLAEPWPQRQTDRSSWGHFLF